LQKWCAVNDAPKKIQAGLNSHQATSVRRSADREPRRKSFIAPFRDNKVICGFEKVIDWSRIVLSFDSTP
jgi:hypothetical protein